MKEIKILFLSLIISLNIYSQENDVLEFEKLDVVDTLFNISELNCIEPDIIMDTAVLFISKGLYGYNMGAHMVKKEGGLWIVYNLPYDKDVFDFEYSDDSLFLTYNNSYFGGGNGHFGTSLSLCIIDLYYNSVLNLVTAMGEIYWPWYIEENETEEQFQERTKNDYDTCSCFSDVVLTCGKLTIQNYCEHKTKTGDYCGYCADSGFYLYKKGKFVKP
jgi:hypothetical protein